MKYLSRSLEVHIFIIGNQISSVNHINVSHKVFTFKKAIFEVMITIRDILRQGHKLRMTGLVDRWQHVQLLGSAHVVNLSRSKRL